MKIQIRRNVFETNSSSTHSIAIPRKETKPNFVSFNMDDFGWEFAEADAANYLYTAIYDTAESKEDAEEKINKIKEILDANGIKYDFSEVKTHISGDYFYLDDGYIDHCYELKGFVNMLLNDEDKLLRFLGGGLVFTGNDNCPDEMMSGFVNRTEEFLYDWDTKSYSIKNEYYMENHMDYEWFEKGN